MESRILGILALAAGLAWGQAVRPPDVPKPSPFQTLRAALAQLRRVRQDTIHLREAWARERAELVRERESLAGQAATLAARLKRLRAQREELEKKRTAREKRLRALTEARARLETELERFRRWLLAFEDRSLPPGRSARRERLQALAAGRLPLRRRLEALLAHVFARLAQARSVDLCEDTVAVDGEELFVEGFRVGLVAAFAATPDGRRAFQALPAGETLRWEPAPPELAALVERVRSQLLRRRAPALEPVPFPAGALRAQRVVPPFPAEAKR